MVIYAHRFVKLERHDLVSTPGILGESNASGRNRPWRKRRTVTSQPLLENRPYLVPCKTTSHRGISLGPLIFCTPSRLAAQVVKYFPPNLPFLHFCMLMTNFTSITCCLLFLLPLQGFLLPPEQSPGERVSKNFVGFFPRSPLRENPTPRWASRGSRSVLQITRANVLLSTRS